MNSYKKKLTLIIVVLVSFSVMVTGVVASQWIQKTTLESERTHMEQELLILKMKLEQDLANDDRQEEQQARLMESLQELAPALEARITWASADGQAIYDSEESAEASVSGESFLQLEEIGQAAVQGIGHATRVSKTTGESTLFVAASIGNSEAPQGFVRVARESGQMTPPMNEIWFFIIACLLMVLIAALIVTNRTVGTLTDPLEQMTRVAWQITHHNSHVRVERNGADEISQLGQAINTMADSLQKQVEQIRQNESRLKRVLDNMHSGVMMIDRNGIVVMVNRSGEDIFGFSSRSVIGRPCQNVDLPQELLQRIQLCLSNQESSQSELTVYYPEEAILDVSINPFPDFQEEGYGVLVVLHNLTAVRRLERMRSEFVANVSHELKTPVASVKGFAETLLAGAVNDRETANSFLQIIYDESERINRIIGDLLELSKIESKREPLHFSPVDLEQMIEQTVQVMNAEARKKKIEVTSEVAPGLFIEADEDRLRQIIVNLLSNGVSYTPEGGSVRIEAQSLEEDSGEPDKVRITISDTGMGIPKKDLPRIFERFYRVDKARSRSSGGTGLGLSIVKHLTELHHGSIRVESEVGVGSVFIIELPVIQEMIEQ